MVVVMMVLVTELFHLLVERVVLHRLADLRAGELVPGRGDQLGVGIEPFEQLGRRDDLFVRGGVGTAHDDEVGVRDLVVEELAEVAHIHLGLAGVHNSGAGADHGALHALDGARDVAELADARGLDQDAVGRKVVHDLFQRLGEVAHERAADAAGVHLGDLNARVLQKAAVDGDLSEFIFDQHQLFARIGLRDQLADQRGLARAEEAGEDINGCHYKNASCAFYFQKVIISCFFLSNKYKA